MLYALRFFDTERSLWYLDCVHRSKPFLKRREKKFKTRNKDDDFEMVWNLMFNSLRA